MKKICLYVDSYHPLCHGKSVDFSEFQELKFV